MILAGFVLLLLAMGGQAWLNAHPEHDPRKPLNLDGPEGWATKTKLAGLRGEEDASRDVLTRAGVEFTALNPTGSGACSRPDRVRPANSETRGLSFAPSGPEMTSPMLTGLAWWLEHRAQPSAQAIMGSRIARIEHYGTYNCRRINGASNGWSEHATGNAIDISALVLEDGTRVTVRRDWWTGPDSGEAEPDREAIFLAEIRDGACDVFGTVLSPDYNALHADHFHIDQAKRGFGSACR